MNNILINEINLWFDSSTREEKNYTRLYRQEVKETFPLVIDKTIKILKLDKSQIQTLKIEDSCDHSTQSPHADTPKGQTTVILPLIFNTPVSTILYQSWYNGNNKIGYKHRPSGKTYYNSEWLSDDIDKVTGLSDEPFDTEFYNQWLSNYRYEDLHGLTVDRIYKWEIGVPIYFSANQLHSGSYFNGTKRWLVIHFHR